MDDVKTSSRKKLTPAQKGMETSELNNMSKYR